MFEDVKDPTGIRYLRSKLGWQFKQVERARQDVVRFGERLVEDANRAGGEGAGK